MPFNCRQVSGHATSFAFILRTRSPERCSEHAPCNHVRSLSAINVKTRTPLRRSALPHLCTANMPAQANAVVPEYKKKPAGCYFAKVRPLHLGCVGHPPKSMPLTDKQTEAMRAHMQDSSIPNGNARRTEVARLTGARPVVPLAAVPSSAVITHVAYSLTENLPHNISYRLRPSGLMRLGGAKGRMLTEPPYIAPKRTNFSGHGTRKSRSHEPADGLRPTGARKNKWL